MKHRYLMGYNKSLYPGLWKTNGGGRPKGSPVLHDLDLEVFRAEIERLGAKRLLEFGPGASTDVFVDLGLEVTTIEHIEKWYEVAKERFKDNPKVRVLKGEDEMPFAVPDLDPSEKFDLAFVDAPQGYPPLRKAHKGYEDCSRLNACLFALEHAPVVMLHDAHRPLERGSLNRLNRMGYLIEMIRVPFGMARITCPQQDKISSTERSATSEPCRKAKRRTRTPTRRSATSSPECSPSLKQEMSSTSQT